MNTKTFRALQWAAAALIGVGLVVGIGYAIHYQMNWRQRVDDSVEKVRREFEARNELTVKAAKEKMQRESEESDRRTAEAFYNLNRINNNLQEKLQGDTEDDNHFVDLGFGVGKRMGEIRDYAARKGILVDSAIESLRAAASQKAIEDAAIELQQN